ncbi:MAG TPA: two-component regulator propeller domain-containing protein [Candidatus Angelobacter sp.]|nr:two-component regulator propeller domain-containing protein [Candidatus Angelobacter sp.]
MLKRVQWLLFFCLTGTGWCLDPHKPISQYIHTVWRSEDGLPQNSIQALLQARDGYLWIGTQEGLVRFNGLEFKVFNKANTDAIRHNDIRILYQDHEGTLWVGTFGGGLVRYRGGQFSTYTTKQGLSNNSITAIFEDHQGNLWVGTTEGLNRLTSGQFANFTRQNGLSDNSIQTIGEDAQGHLLVATRTGFDIFQNGVFVPALPTSMRGKALVTAFLLDQDKNLWIGTENRGLSRANPGKKMIQYGAAEGLPNAPIHAIFEDNQRTIWVGTEGGGMCRLVAQRFECYSTQNGLSGSYVEAITQDREGDLWVGTETGGLNRFKETPLSNYGPEIGLQGSPRALFEDREGALWIGTNTGLWRFKDGKTTPYLTRNGPANNYVYSMFVDREGNVWVGTDEGGLNKFTGHAIKTYRKSDGLADDFIPAVFQDRDGDLWIGTFSGGVSRLHNGKFTNYTTREGLGNNRVWAIQQDHAGNLWFGTDAGLSLFRNGAFTNFDFHENAQETLGMGGVMVIHEDSDRVLWIGTYGAGLKRFKDGKLAGISVKQGLFDDTIWSILEDDSGNFWMSSNRGIFKVKKSDLINVVEGRLAELQSKAYGVADGMISAECNGGSQYSGWKTKDGKLLFACLKSVVVVDPNHLPQNPLPPPVVIEAVKINQMENMAVGARVPAGSGEVEFRFSALSYFAPEKVAFQCKLEGYDDDWKAAPTPGFIRYTNLDPGNYTFRVKAANNDGVWNDEGASFSFYLEPHFYQTRWFYFLCALVLVLSPVGIYLLRVRQIRKTEQELTVLVGRRTRELQAAKEVAEAATRAKSDFLANMSHEIRTPLNGVTGMLDLMAQSEMSTDQKQLLEVARDSANTLMVVINDILDFSKIEAGKLAFEVREFDLLATVAEAARTMALRAHQKGLELVYQVDPRIPQVLLGDANRLKQVLHNLVGNAVKFTDRGEVVLRVTLERIQGDQAELRFAVSDTGIGIPADKQELIFDAFSQGDASTTRKFGGTGLGLAIASRIVKLMGGAMSVVSQAGNGSTFYFTVMMQVPTQSGSARLQVPPELQDITVLIVDDNQNSRAVLGEVLTGWGIANAAAGSADEAAALVEVAQRKSAPYGLIIIDSGMPGKDGFDLAASIAQRQPKLPLVMMLTSNDYNAGVGRCRELGIDSYLIKPVKQCELLAAIRKSVFPAGEPAMQRTSPPSLSDHLNILLAEDNVVNRALAVGLLEKMGHRVTVAENGREALELLERTTFDVVLMDVQMPEMDGYSATRELRQREQGRQRHIPVIAITAHAMKGDREACIEAGMDGYIAKPIHRAELQKVIEDAVRVSEAISGRD